MSQLANPVEGSSSIKLIVGLGNPGEQYAKTRHNAGFLFIDKLVSELGGSFKLDKHCHGSVAKVQVAEHELRLLKPNTFMNLSGQAVVAALQYYKLHTNQLLIVHDELDLDAGIARLKLSGGHGGNNGLRDIIQKTATKNFARLRLGIGHPGVGRDVAAYVLKRANKDDQLKIDLAIDESLRVLDLIVQGDFARAMNELHTNLTKS